MVDVAPGAAGVDAHGVILRADGGTAQCRQVDDQRVVCQRQACGVVPAAPDGDVDAVGAGELHAGDNVGGVGAAHYGGRVLVDHGVVDGAGLGVAGLPGQDEGAAQGGGQCFVRCGSGPRCDAHRCLLPVRANEL